MEKNISYKKGVSLIEVLLVIALILIIMIPVFSFERDVLKNNSSADDSLQTIAAARIIVRTMVKELRSASLGTDGSYPLQTVATSTLTFFSDTDNDGLKERIRYYLSGTLLKRGSTKPTGSPPVYNLANEVNSILFYNVRNGTSTPIFEYYDSTYDGTTAPLSQPVSVAGVRLVKINVLIDQNPITLPPARLYTSEVMLRNIKDNL